MEKLQQRQPMVTKVSENWGVFLIGSQGGGPLQAIKANPDHHAVKTVAINLFTDEQGVTAPTASNLRQLERPKMRAHMQGSIMESILNGHDNKKAPRSQALS